MPKIRLTCLDLTAEDAAEDERSGTLIDCGPWTADLWKPEKDGGQPRVVLQSDDFTHDVALIVTGDFSNTAQKMRYAQALARCMNKMPLE
jgi:hypothetical protein